MAVRLYIEAKLGIGITRRRDCHDFLRMRCVAIRTQADAVIKENSDVESSGEFGTVTVTGEVIRFDSSADRTLMHHMWENLVVSPK